MKNVLKFTTLFLAVLTVSFSSCSKSDIADSIIDALTPDYKAILTSHSWKFSGAATEATDAASLEVLALMNEDKDGVFTYNADGTAVSKVEGEADETSSWSITDNVVTLYKGTEDEFEATITMATDAMITYDAMLNNVKFTFTFVK